MISHYFCNKKVNAFLVGSHSANIYRAPAATLGIWGLKKPPLCSRELRTVWQEERQSSLCHRLCGHPGRRPGQAPGESKNWVQSWKREGKALGGQVLSRQDAAEERLSELQGISVDTLQTEEQRGSRACLPSSPWAWGHSSNGSPGAWNAFLRDVHALRGVCPAPHPLSPPCFTASEHLGCAAVVSLQCGVRWGPRSS